MFIAVRTGLEPATPCVTGMYSNQAELPHPKFLLFNGRGMLPQLLRASCNRWVISLFAGAKIRTFSIPTKFFSKKITQMMHFFEKMRNDPTNKGYKQEKSSRALQPGCRYFIFNKTQV